MNFLYTANPAAIPVALEEMLRWDTPIMAMPRVVARDVAIAGHHFSAGESVYLHYSSGNRDAAKFPDAERCVLDRKPNAHLVFGQGIHTCMGAPLARMEIKVALEELLSRKERFSLDGEVVRTIFHRRTDVTRSRPADIHRQPARGRRRHRRDLPSSDTCLLSH